MAMHSAACLSWFCEPFPAWYLGHLGLIDTEVPLLTTDLLRMLEPPRLECPFTREPTHVPAFPMQQMTVLEFSPEKKVPLIHCNPVQNYAIEGAHLFCFLCKLCCCYRTL